MIIEINDRQEKREIDSSILNSLPEWFGLPESTKTYILELQNMPF